VRVEFLTQEDPIYVLTLFEEFFREYGGAWEVARISCCRTMGNRPRRQLLRELAQLYGPLGLTRLVSRAALSRLLGPLPLDRGAKHYFSLPQLCRAYNVEYQSIGNPNSPEFIRSVEERHCDLIVSVACPYILKKQLLGLPPLGCINIHHAPLPRYKGMMPTFWQMYHGENRVGLTIHTMDEKLDEGVALLQEELEIEPGETLDHLIRRSKRHAAHCLAGVLRNIASNSVTTRPLDREPGSRFTFPTFQEIREFQQRGLRAI
jgi:methionyl-tRNA formyltransferase